jgi:hypothetical protein
MLRLSQLAHKLVGRGLLANDWNGSATLVKDVGQSGMMFAGRSSGGSRGGLLGRWVFQPINTEDISANEHLSNTLYGPGGYTAITEHKRAARGYPPD